MVAGAVGLFRHALCLPCCSTVLPELSPCCCPGSLRGSIPPCVLSEILGTRHKLGNTSLCYVVLPGLVLLTCPQTGNGPCKTVAYICTQTKTYVLPGMLLRVMACRWANNVAVGCPMRAVASILHQRVRRCTDLYNGTYRLLYTFPGNLRRRSHPTCRCASR